MSPKSHSFFEVQPKLHLLGSLPTPSDDSFHFFCYVIVCSSRILTSSFQSLFLLYKKMLKVKAMSSISLAVPSVLGTMSYRGISAQQYLWRGSSASYGTASATKSCQEKLID